MKLQVLLLGLLCFQSARAGDFSAVCQPSTGFDFEMMFKYDSTGEAGITGLNTYPVSEGPNFQTIETGTGCSSTTKSGNIYSITIQVSVSASPLPCGSAATANADEYKFVVSPTGSTTMYIITCVATNLDIDPTVETVPGVDSGHLQMTTDMNFDPAVTLSVVTPTSNTPGSGVAVTTVSIGTPTKIRMELNKGSSNVGSSSLTITDLIAADDNTFSGETLNIITSGCNTNDGVAGSVGLFSAVDTTANPVVLETNVFEAFRLTPSLGPESVFFRVEFTWCMGDLTACNVCAARKKRSADSHHRHLDIELRVTDEPRDQGQGQGRTGCGTTVLYWAPHAILMVLILLEGAVVSHMLCKKIKMN